MSGKTSSHNDCERQDVEGAGVGFPWQPASPRSRLVSTALAAADAGATLTVVSDACAGSTPENHAAALTVMGLYPPQISIATTDEVLAAR